ncbi:MAG: HAD-IB family hydrolase, partial [Acidimicrobiales bacterium]|nr:HAD-IB family hydrolase [Acidimicrobiales bacterium]
RAAAGWPREAVQRVGEAVVEPLLAAVAPFARLLIAEHQTAGRPVVMATTTPYDVVAPFAAALGLDGVVATRYAVRDDGAYDGSIDGPFVWGRGKLQAVKEWGRAHGVELRDSWAYSDSFYDLPLLSAVGHPTAVNPDVRLAVVATARRWPALHLDVPPGVPKLAGVEPQQALLPLVRPELIPYARFDVDGVEHLPKLGPAIICGNHRSYFD